MLLLFLRVLCWWTPSLGAQVEAPVKGIPTFAHTHTHTHVIHKYTPAAVGLLLLAAPAAAAALPSSPSFSTLLLQQQHPPKAQVLKQVVGACPCVCVSV